MSNRSMKDFLKYARQTVEPEEEKKEIGLSDYITEGHAWDDLVIGAGQFLQNIADMTERATRPDDKTPSEWEKHQSGLLKNFLTGTRATATNLQEGRETPELEDASAPYFLRNMLRSAPESIGTMVGGFMLGAPFGGLLGAAGRAGVGAAMKSSAARSALANIQSAYNAQNIGGKIARATIPTSPTTWSSLFSSAGLEANSERQQAINELIDNAKRNGTYIPDQTELEAEQRTQDIFGGNLAWIALNNLPQYGLMFGKPARSILGKLGKGILAGNSEGVEEVGQQAIHDYVLGESPNFKNYRDSYVTGFGMGAGMHGGVGAARYAADRITGQPSEEELEEALKAYKAKRKEASKIFSEDYVDFRGEVQSALDAQGAYREQTARQGYRDATESIGIDNFMRAIGQQESGGDYEATNGRTGASGKFQIMPENWSAWAQDAGLPADAPMTPENQERVARNKMLEYYNRFGNWRDVAIAWYAGEGEVTNPSFNHDAPQGNGDEPSVNEYADSVMSRFEKFGGGEQKRGGNIFGVENYDMPTQGDNITQQVSQLKDGWQSVIPQIGGVLKDRFGINATISSAARSANHNADVGGAPNSYHIIRDEGGDALDIVFDRDTSQEEQDRIADYFKNTGLFSEVLYHDVGSGAHLHLGGLKTDNIQSRADQLFNERYDPNNISTPQWQQRTNRRQEEPEQEEPSKPLFDINADDEQTQNLFERFARERHESTANEDRDAFYFFDDMFNDNGEFQNTPENRAAINERYGDELNAWAANILKQEPQEQPAQPAQPAQPKPQRQQGTQSQTGLVASPVMQSADNFLEQLRQNKNAPQTLLALQQARNAGDVTAVENILKQNNVPIQTQEPIQNNAETEPVATQPQQNKGKPKLTPEERMIHTARKPVAEGKKNVEKRKKHGKALIKIADKKRIEIPSVDRVALENGSTVIVQKWRDKLLESGALPAPQPQEQPTQPEQPAQPQPPQPPTPPTPPAENPNDKILQARENVRQQEREKWEGIKQGYQEHGDEVKRQAQAEEEVRQHSAQRANEIIQEKAERDLKSKQKTDLQSLAPPLPEEIQPQVTQQEQTTPAPQTQQGQSQPVNSPYFIADEEKEKANPYVARSQGFDSKYYSDVRDAAQRHGGNNVVGSATSFAFSKPEDRDAFIQEAHNIISPQRQTQSQPAPQPQQNVAEEPTQPETQNEQPQQESQPEKQPEDDRNVFDLLPETGELNDVEEETPQTQPVQKGTQQESHVTTQSLPTPNPKRRRSKKAQALHGKMKTDTHPFIGEYLDRLFEHAKNKEDSYERQRALWELKHYEEIDITDEMLDEAESRFKQQHEERELPQEQPTQEPKPKIQNQELQTEQPQPENAKPVATIEPQKPEKKSKRTAINSAGNELRAKINADTYPHLRSLLDGLLERAATAEGKGARKELKRWSEELKWLEDNDMLVLALGNADENLKRNREKVDKRNANVLARTDIDESFKQHLLARNEELRHEYFDPRYSIDKYTELRKKIDQIQDKELQAKATDLLNRYDATPHVALPAIRELEQLLERDAQTPQGERQPQLQDKTGQQETEETPQEQPGQKGTLFTKYEGTDVADTPIFGAGIKKDILSRIGVVGRLTFESERELDALAKKFHILNGSKAQEEGLAHGYAFRTAEDRDNFIKAVSQAKIYDKEIDRQSEINKAELKKRNAQREEKSRQEEIGKNINEAKEEAFKILEGEKFPAIRAIMERSMASQAKPTNVAEANALAKKLIDVSKQVRDNGEIGRYALQGLLDEWMSKKLKVDITSPDLRSWRLNSKDSAKYDAATEIVSQMNRGELTAEEAYAELERFLKTGRRSKKTIAKSKAEPKHDIQGDKDTVNTDISNVVDDKDLTPAQKLLQSFGKKLGVIVKFVNNPDSNFRGVHSKGVTFLNVNSNKALGKVFWHESFHWLRNNNPELYKALVKAASITTDQREAYLKETKRTDIRTPDEINEEILCDMMDDVAKRTGLFQSIAGKNRGLVERAIQWLKDTLNKFIDHFRNPQGKLTTKQAQSLADEFGRMADQIVDPNGDKIFRYNRRTQNVELAGGRNLSDTNLAIMRQKNAQFGTKYSIDSNDNSKQSFSQRIKNIISGEPQNRSIHAKMKRRLESLSKMKIAAGHLPEGLHVKIDEVARVIRTGREYDWMNVLPSVGNEVAKQLNITQSAEMGNYIGKFLLDGAPNDTSAEATEFAKAMRDNPEMRDKIMAVRDVFDEWNNMSSEEQMIASTRYDKETAPLKERATKAFREFRAQFFDSQLPIHYHVAAFEKATGLKLADSINPEIAFRNLRGMQPRAKQMIYGTEKTTEALKKFYPSIDFTGFKPLAVILESIKAAPETDAYKNFDQYIKACHFMDIHAHNNDIRQQQAALRSEIRNLETALNQTKNKTDAATLRKAIKKKEAQLDSLAPKIMETPEAYSEKNCADFIAAHKSEFDAAQKDIVKYSQTLLAIMADSGVISRSRYFSLLKAFPNYVPLPRAFDENENLSAADSLKHMLGSTKDPKDSIAAISNNTFDMIQRAEKNKAKLLLANLANFDGVGGIFELVDKGTNDGTIITFYENGKRKYLQCEDESIVKAVNSMNIPTMNLFLKVLRVPAAILRATATGVNPSFIAGNLLRDTQDAFIFSKQYGGSNITSIVKDLPKSLNPITTYKYLMEAVNMSELYEEYAVSGAAQADFFSFDRDYKQEAIERLTKKNFKQIATPKGILQFLEQLGEWSELATRLRQYDKVKQSLAAEHGGINIYDDLVTAAFESRDLIDFARHGAAGQTWNTLTAFANPVLQGFDKQWRTYDFQKLKKFGGTEQTEKEWKISVTRLFLESVLPALVLTLLHKDEDWYKDDVQPWEKENYWILNEYMRVPKGADVGIRFFSNLTELLVSNESAKVSEVLRPLIGMLPDLMPTAFMPIFECMANYDLFRRRPIVPQRETNLYKDTPELQYGATSSKTAVFLGKQLGVSPRYIDHFIYGYTSGVGKGIVHAIDTVTPGRHAPWTRDWIPFLGRTLRTPYLNPKIVSDYYEEFSRQESFAQRTVWEKKHGNPNAKPPAEYDRALHARLKSINRAMQNLNSQERAIMDDPKLTSEQVEEKRKAIQEQRIKLCKKAFGQAR